MSLHRLTREWLASAPERCLILSPTATRQPGLAEPRVSLPEHRAWLENAQRMRANRYRQDGAVTDRDLVHGRWISPEDTHAYQLLVCDKFGMVIGSMWYADDPSPNLRELHCYHPTTADALEGVRRQARRDGIGFTEMGGWAATTARANLLLLLLTGVFHRARTPSLAAVIITTRHKANCIIRTMGGTSPAVAPYWDDRFQCEMELLVIDSRVRNSAYEAEVEALAAVLSQIPVIAWVEERGL